MIRSNFQSKGVEQMLESNFKAYCAQAEEVSLHLLCFLFPFEWKLITSTCLLSCFALHYLLFQLIPADFNFSEKLEEVLVNSGYAQTRASKMDVDDFLKWVRITYYF